MELEIGLKITKTRDGNNLTSSDLRITKDRAGPLFFSSETDSMFVLTAHLKGYKKERIRIDINEDGTQIAISGEKAIQEMVMVRWTMYNKEVEIKRFKKVFMIPDGVVLDKIKARFNQEDTILSIFMPKLKKGIRGIGIEEVKVVDGGDKSEIKPNLAEEIPERETNEETVIHEGELEEPEIDQLTENPSSEIPEIRREIESEEISPTEVEEIPGMVIQEPEIENVESLEIQSEVIDQPPLPDSVFSEEIRPELPVEVAQQTENEEIPEFENKFREAESKEEEDQCLQETAELMEVEPDQMIHLPTEQITDEDISKEEKTEEPEQEQKKHEELVEDTSILSPEIIEPIELKPDPGVRLSETLDQSPPAEQHIEDYDFQSEKIYEAVTEVLEEKEEVINQVELPQEQEQEPAPEQEPGVVERETSDYDEEEEEEPIDTDITKSPINPLNPWQRSPFRAPRFIVGSAFIGFLIALVIQLLRKNKKTRKYGIS